MPPIKQKRCTMTAYFKNLTEDQLSFLAVLYAAESSIPLDVAEMISPILLGSFLDLTGRNNKRALIQETQNGQIFILPGLPQKILEQVNGFIRSGGLSALLGKPDEIELRENIPHEILSNLYFNTAQYNKLAEIHTSLAKTALKSGNQQLAVRHFLSAIHKLSGQLGSPEVDLQFVVMTLNLWDICVAYGGWPTGFVVLLEKALKAAQRLGDRVPTHCSI